ncbi:restriction endonuclease subunit S [Vibrio parahaemolyticus]|uniref:restriction endonuclease subunit S n=1 Tax=Vibrio TaxID=662 RepID=UPI001B83A3B5|nr:restriction endonuclease subunit S [Vibrio parahaemolyticus]EGU0150176.1 restriction endonuclease subunit S [Vibrio parahaemolyticus]MCR9766815.1 restriction endonuclease subunit S [Vibrio parahaemolyticus]MDF4306266.1 restriction endonuclease subunit S [Vibrio parahaemolyticus]MDF5670407.1 restriction endonuclease subunit S [Vibrio parahaemolyticus]MDG2729949.1 restriction endonuclease subunit S [Vibrio parahaemolyticus]
MESITKMPKYESYKSSGIDSFDSLPSHWTIARFHDVFGFSKGLNITKENLQDDGVSCINYGEIHSKYGFELDPSVHQLKYVDVQYLSKNSKSLLKLGDFIFADTSEDFEGAGNFTYLKTDAQIFAGYHTLIARMKKERNARYLAYVLESMGFRLQIRRAVKGVKVFSITQNILKGTKVWFADEIEQKLIVKYLDRKIELLDKAISIKVNQVSLLKEYKQIIIQKVLMQGLDRSSPMKDSGVDWMGKIPKHWEVKRLKYVLEERSERSKTGEEPLFMMSQVHGLVVRADYHEKAEVAASKIDNKIVYENDLVFNKLKAHLGVFFKSAIPFRGLVSPDYAVYKCKSHIVDAKYLELLFRHPSYIEQFIIRATGIVEGLIRLYTDDLFEIAVPVAPSEEQKEILNHIDIKAKEIDQAIDVQQLQIDKLKEYKTSLINSVVTGKIKITPEMVED